MPQIGYFGVSLYGLSTYGGVGLSSSAIELIVDSTFVVGELTVQSRHVRTTAALEEPALRQIPGSTFEPHLSIKVRDRE